MFDWILNTPLVKELCSFKIKEIESQLTNKLASKFDLNTTHLKYNSGNRLKLAFFADWFLYTSEIT